LIIDEDDYNVMSAFFECFLDALHVGATILRQNSLKKRLSPKIGHLLEMLYKRMVSEKNRKFV
jgi:hypothetical protein